MFRPSAEFLGESDEKPLRPADVAEPIHVFILDDVADDPRAALAKPFKRLVDVVQPHNGPFVRQRALGRTRRWTMRSCLARLPLRTGGRAACLETLS